jgi:hypothetical protein
MSRMLFVSAVLVLLLQAPEVFSRPPEGPSGQMVLQEVSTLKAEVNRLEKEAAKDENKAEDLALARARLAAAEGKTRAACAEWRKVIAARQERLTRFETLARRAGGVSDTDYAIVRGSVAEALCGLAEVERDRATLARELPKVITCHEAWLEIIDVLRKQGDYDSQKAEEEERAIHKELREARLRLDAVKRK